MWYNALEESKLEDQFQFLYGVVHSDGVAVAIAPAFVMNVPISQVVPQELLPIFNLLGKIIPSLLYQRTFFIGSPCSDEGTVGMIAGSDSYRILDFVQKNMSEKAKELNCPMFVWKDFPVSYNEGLSKIAVKHGLFKMVGFPGTHLHFKGDYLSSLKSSHRYNLKKKLRISKEKVTIETSFIQNPDTDTLDQIFALFRQTYEKATIRFENLNHLFFKNIAKSDNSYFTILRDQKNGEMLAFMLCFVFEKHLINKFIGLDYKRPKDWFLYFRLWEATLKYSSELDINSIQSGQTGYKPKLELGNKLIELTHYCRHSNPIINLIYKIFAAKVSWSTLEEDLAIHIKAHPTAL
ncbi:MAG: GNAT family N-acetyltransferase [Pseudomonadota bacterium]